jgi:Ca2+-binding EF-hand superfamily protein
MTPTEKVALLSAYDLHNNDSISMEDFRQLFKRTPSLRRQELISLFYSLLDPLSEGIVNFSVLESQLSSSNYGMNIKAAMFMEFLRNLNTKTASDFTVDDFYDYYVEASSEIEHDDDFEELLKKTWSALQR